MNQVLFEQLFANTAEKFGIAKFCRENQKDYDLQSMMIAMRKKICNQEPIDEDKLNKLAEEYNFHNTKLRLVDGYGTELEEYGSSINAYKAGYRQRAKEE